MSLYNGPSSLVSVWNSLRTNLGDVKIHLKNQGPASQAKSSSSRTHADDMDRTLELQVAAFSVLLASIKPSFRLSQITGVLFIALS